MSTKTIYYKSNIHRDPKYRIYTRIVDDNNHKYVEKVAYDDRAKHHIKRIKDNYHLICELYNNITVLPYENVYCSDGSINDLIIRFPYVEGTNLLKVDFENDSFNIIKERIEALLEVLFDYKNSYMSEFIITEEFKKEFPGCYPKEGVPAVNIGNVDGCLRNVLLSDKTYIYDYEWVYDFPIPIDYLKYRTLRNDIYYIHKKLASRMSCSEWLDEFFDGKDYSVFYDMETCFMSNVHGKNEEWNYIMKNQKSLIPLNDFKDDYHNVSTALDMANNEINNLINSKSWRITKPLRKLARILE